MLRVALLLLVTRAVLADSAGCEDLTAPYGHIQSEDGNYQDNTERCWHIHPPGKSRVLLSFKYFRTEANYDYVDVFDGADISAPRLSPEAGFSGSVVPKRVNSTQGEMIVRFHADFLVRMAGFTFAWTSDNGHDLPASSPLCALDCNKRTDLHNGVCDKACFNEQCNWDGDDCLGMCNATAACRADQLGDGTCDPQCLVPGCGFDDSDCECRNVTHAPYGYQNDGSAPLADYSNMLHRCWQIALQGPDAANRRIALSFARFDVEKHFDLVTVFDGATVAAPSLYTGRGFSGLASKPEQLAVLRANSSGPSLLVHFDTDTSETESGFLFGWTTLPLPPPAEGCALDCRPNMPGDGTCDAACMNAFCDWDKGDCDAEVFECVDGCTTDLIGDGQCQLECLNAACNWDNRDCECDTVLEGRAGFRTDGSSPGSDYGSDETRCWLIRPKDANVANITLSFERFDTEVDWDVVHVYDGANIGAPQLYPGGISGFGYVDPATSSGPKMLVTFRSDSSNTESGFTFGWTSTARGETLPAGEQCGPPCHPETDLHNGVCDTTCMNEACEWDGGDCSGTCVGLPISAGGPGIEPTPSTCYLSQLGNGHCDIECYSADCNWDYRDCECETVLTETSGYRSDGSLLGADYENEQRLCWVIRPKLPPPHAPNASADASISLTFRRFDTEGDYDRLRIFDGNRIFSPQLSPREGFSGLLKGPQLPAATSSTGQMLIMFSSDESVTESGFLFGWTTRFKGEELPAGHCAINCTEDMMGDGHCDDACMNAECDWDWDEELQMSDCDRQCAPGCSMSLLGNGICEAACSTAACNWDYRDCECATVLDTCEGSANDGSDADSSYENNADACWLIRPKARASSIRLHWTRFDTEARYDSVSVYDGGSEKDPTLSPVGGFSGELQAGPPRFPPDLLSTSGELLIRFNTDRTVASERGFSFSWTCNATVPAPVDGGVPGGASRNLLINAPMISAPLRPLAGWRILSGADTHSPVEALHLDGNPCCDVAPKAGAQMIATGHEWFVRQQEVDLVHAGLPTTFLDLAPEISISERFAQMPPGDDDQYFLFVELLDEVREPIVSFGKRGPKLDPNDEPRPAQPYWAFSAADHAQCTADCRLTRGDGSPFWKEVSHTFRDYGPGVRYVRWRDGGRDGGGYGRLYGTLLDAPSLTVDLRQGAAERTAAERTAAAACSVSRCNYHGRCVGGACACDPGYRGAACEEALYGPLAVRCAHDCNGHGTCTARTTLQGAAVGDCHCEEGWSGPHCTVESTALPGDLCPAAPGIELHYHRGINVALRAYDARRMIDSASLGAFLGNAAIPLVSDGAILPDGRDRAGGGGPPLWSTVPPLGMDMNSDNLTITVTSAEAVQVGTPKVILSDPHVLKPHLRQWLSEEANAQFRTEHAGAFESQDPSVQLLDTSLPLDLRVHFECLQPGATKLDFLIPVLGYCDLKLTWKKICSKEAVDVQAAPSSGGGAGAAGWVVSLLLLCCCGSCCYWCLLPGGALPEDQDPVLGLHGPSSMRPSSDGIDNKRPWTWSDVQYASLTLSSRLRGLKNEVLSGQLRLEQLPLRLRIAVTRLRDDEETREML